MPSNDRKWCVYIVQCSDGTLYTGITKDIEKRITQHNSNRIGAKYTKGRRPVKLAYFEVSDSRSNALKREYQIRKLSLADKIALIVHNLDTCRKEYPKVDPI